MPLSGANTNQTCIRHGQILALNTVAVINKHLQSGANEICVSKRDAAQILHMELNEYAIWDKCKLGCLAGAALFIPSKTGKNVWKRNTLE